MHRIRAICSDIDGTLLSSSKKLSEENAAAIREAIGMGIAFILVSGRMPYATRRFYEAIGVESIYSVYNGGALYSPDGRVISETRLDDEAARTILTVSERYGAEGILFDGDEWYLESRDGYAYANKIGIYGKDCRTGSFPSLLSSFRTNKYLLMSDDSSVLAAAWEELRSLGLDESRVSYYPGKDFLEIMPPGVDKGRAIREIAEYTGIGCDKIMAIGDDWNDIPMLMEAGLAIAMGNAPEEVKAAASAATSDCDSSGLAEAIRRYCFNQKEEL